MIELFATPGVYGQKVRIVLEETGLSYVLTRLDPPEDALLDRAPSLRDPHGPDGLPIQIAESAAIALYLARKARKLGPEGAREVAAFDYWAHAISSTLAPLFAVHAYFRAHDGEALALFDAAVAKALHAFEEHIATRHFMIGERFTVIDALLYPHLAASAPTLSQGLSPFPNLTRYRDRLALREGIRRAMA
ncbi:MAG: glutathione S-transferase family protein [Hyphomonadaceae bacterium]|nr:glutathione S-transferase family protein [Hyphomonadaceae bacterium]